MRFQSEKDRSEANEQISQLELSLVGNTMIPAEDILPSIRDLKAMCHLYSSLVRTSSLVVLMADVLRRLGLFNKSSCCDPHQ